MAFKNVTPLEIASLGAIRSIDVRQPEEFSLGRVPGSELVPLGELMDAAKEWDREVPLLLICRSGNRSSHAAMALAQAGFTSLYNLAGGMLAYAETELPIEK